MLHIINKYFFKKKEKRKKILIFILFQLKFTMFITSRSNVISIVLVIFSTLLLLCSSFDNSITYKEENAILSKVQGVYADGSILFELDIGKKRDNLRLLKPDGSIMFIEIPNMFQSSDFVSDKHTLNPNYIILNNDTAIIIMDWTGNISNTIKYSTFGVSKKNDSKFLVIDQENSDLQKILYTEYTVSSDSTGKIVMNGNPAIQQIQYLSLLGLTLKDIKIFSLNDAWMLNLASDNKPNYIVIISAETKNQTLIPIPYFSINRYGSDCSVDNNNNFQYYCLYKRTDNTLKLDTIRINKFTIPGGDLTISPWSWTNSIFTISGGFLLRDSVDRTKTTYYVMNPEIDYTHSNALGELIMDLNDRENYDSPYILPNNTMVNIINDGSSITFLSTDLYPMIPPKSMYSDFFIIFYIYSIFIIAY
jgi:hypothetical protein